MSVTLEEGKEPVSRATIVLWGKTAGNSTRCKHSFDVVGLPRLPRITSACRLHNISQLVNTDCPAIDASAFSSPVCIGKSWPYRKLHCWSPNARQRTEFGKQGSTTRPGEAGGGATATVFCAKLRRRSRASRRGMWLASVCETCVRHKSKYCMAIEPKETCSRVTIWPAVS